MKTITKIALVFAVVAVCAAGYWTARPPARTALRTVAQSTVPTPTPIPIPIPIPKSSQEIALASLRKSVDRANALLESQESQRLDRTNYSGWGVNPLLFSLLDAYTITGDAAWLDQLAGLTTKFIAWRSDKRGLVDYAGESKPQWFRIDLYNIFAVSPFHPYDPSEQTAIMKERGWQNLYYSDINYDGLFLAPMLRFANTIRENDLHEYDDLAAKIVNAGMETVNSHDSEWVALSEKKGFYTFPKNSPFYLDGVEMPINEAAIFGSTLVELYAATNDTRYLDRAEAMVNNWTDYLSFGADGIVHQPYTTGAWLKGWDETNSPSVNTPVAKPVTTPEVFHKASLTIDFLFNLAKYRSTPGIAKYLAGFTRLLEKTEEIGGNQVAFFPRTIAMEMPTDSYHVYNPASFRGFAEISDVTTWERMYLIAFERLHRSSPDIATILALLAIRPHELSEVPKIATSELSISPYSIGQQPAGGCLYSAAEDSSVSIEFTRTTAKHNRLFLSPSADVQPGIRLNVDGPHHYGSAYLEAGDCVNWQWVLTGTAGHSQPATPKENIVKMTVYSAAN